MKLVTAIGVASLAFNGVLAAFLVAGAFRSGSRTETVAPSSPVEAKVVEGEAGLRADTWGGLSSADLGRQRDRLAAEGFPPSAIRAMIAAQVREQFAARRKALDAAMAAAPYWKSPYADPQVQAQLRALAREEQKILTELLGPDPLNGTAARLQRQFPGFAADKVQQLAAIRERYDEQRQDLFTNFRGTITPSEREKMAALDRALQSEFAAVLTPAELEDYNLRVSNTANNIRFRLAQFEPTEAEFRTIHRLQSALDEKFAAGAMSSVEERNARREAQEQMNRQLAEALGPSRYADYERASDYNYQQTSQLVTRLGLKPETAQSLHAVQKEMEERRSAVYANSGANREERERQISLLQKEAAGRVTTLFGGNATAVEAYRQYGGSWLSNFAPRPAPAPSASPR